ncbi:MAG: sigma-70 family RNA polymerase sigma factor [Phycisphaerales bacterium]|nr:sigma-70 family RNA polymerase sigma factor [Phycisphaerales bacterium]
MAGYVAAAGFQPTPWTLLGRLRSCADDERRGLLDELALAYWPPIYWFCRRAGSNHQDAEELAQSFFADKIVRQRLFERADPERGRLRTLVRASLKRHVIDHWRSTSVAERNGAVGGTHDGPLAGAIDRSADQLDAAFDREWAAAKLDSAIRDAERYFIARELDRHWRAFEMRYLQPLNTGAAPPPLQRVAETCGFASAADAAAAVQVVRKRVHTLLRESVAVSVPPAEVDDEYEHLRASLRLARSGFR